MASSATYPPQPDLLDEHARALAWRMLMFLELGFSEQGAERLAARAADHHAVRRALANGCTRFNALRIFT